MNLPASFIDYTRALLGNEEYEKLAAALQQEPPVSIRINKLRMKEEGLSSLTVLPVFPSTKFLGHPMATILTSV